MLIALVPLRHDLDPSIVGDQRVRQVNAGFPAMAVGEGQLMPAGSPRRKVRRRAKAKGSHPQSHIANARHLDVDQREGDASGVHRQCE